MVSAYDTVLSKIRPGDALKTPDDKTGKPFTIASIDAEAVAVKTAKGGRVKMSLFTFDSAVKYLADLGIRGDRWLTLRTTWGAMNGPGFLDWVERRLVLRLRRGDIVLLDNVPAHQSRRVHALVGAAGATLKYLPPYSDDFNPIEPAWALIKKRIRRLAPRTGRALRCTAQRAPRVIRRHHCERWFAHAGYQLIYERAPRVKTHVQ